MKMHRSLWKLLAIGGVCYILGFVLLGFGIIKGGALSSLSIRFDLNSDSWWPFSNGEGKDEESYVYEMSVTPSEEMVISAENVSFTIRKGNKNKLILENINEEVIDMQEEEGVLMLNVTGDTNKNGQTGILELKNEEDVKRISFMISQGEGEIYDMELEELQATSYLGNLYIENVEASSGKIENATGAITVIDGSMSNIEFTNNQGAISYTGDLYEQNQLACENGSIELCLRREKNEYGYDMSASLGSVTIDGETYENENVH